MEQKNFKIFIIPFLFSFAFSQSKGNQVSYASYAIETTTEKYSNVLIDSVYGLWVEVYDRNLITKVNIPIAEIKSIKQNGWRPNIFVSIIGTAAGGFVGNIAGFIGAFILSPSITESFSSQGVLFYIAATGGGALSGYRLVRYIYKRKYEIVDFHKWTIDKKRNYLMSLVNK